MPILYRRFSAFVALLQALSARDLAHAAIPLTAEQLADVRSWTRKLRADRRHLGVLSLGQTVVSTRCTLLQVTARVALARAFRATALASPLYP